MTCPICFEKEADYTTYCKHAFCSTCINKLRKKICPVCRQQIVAGPVNQTYLTERNFEDFRLAEYSRRHNILSLYNQVRIHN